MGQGLNVAKAAEDVTYASEAMIKDWYQKARDRGELVPEDLHPKPSWWMWYGEHDWKIHNWNAEYISYVQGLIARATADQVLMFWEYWHSGPNMRYYYGIQEETAVWEDVACPSCGRALRIMRSSIYQNFEQYCSFCGAAACPEFKVGGKTNRTLAVLIGGGILTGIALLGLKGKK